LIGTHPFIKLAQKVSSLWGAVHTGRGAYQIMDHYKLWSLLSEPDINKIVVASSFLKQTAEALDIHF
jgi:hypothetical protein